MFANANPREDPLAQPLLQKRQPAKVYNASVGLRSVWHVSDLGPVPEGKITPGSGYFAAQIRDQMKSAPPISGEAHDSPQSCRKAKEGRFFLGMLCRDELTLDYTSKL